MAGNEASNRKMKTNRIIPSECLIYNIIDKDLQLMLFPIYMFQSLYLISKFSIINNFITPRTTIWQSIKSVIGATALVISQLYGFNYYWNALDGMRTNIVMFLMFFDLIFYCIISIITHVISASQSENTVELIIILQKCLNSIKIDRKPLIYKNKIQNWVCVISVVFIHLILWLSFIDVSLGFIGAFSSFVVTAPTMVFDLEIVNACRTIVFIKNELVSWIRILEERRKINMKTREEIRNDKISPSVMFDAYIDIITAFRLCHKIYQFVVAYFGFQTFIHILVNLEVVIEIGKTNAEGFYQSIYMKLLSAVWNLKHFVLLVTLSIACENFYKTVKTAEGICAQVLNSEQSIEMRRTCKNVMRVNHASLQKLSAYGIFEIDGEFPLRMLSGLVAYTVVLLQFAFL